MKESKCCQAQETTEASVRTKVLLAMERVASVKLCHRPYFVILSCPSGNYSLAILYSNIKTVFAGIFSLLTLS